MPETSVVIVAYNGLRETTAPCLESIFKDCGGDFEVVVVDNRSSDETASHLRSLMEREPRLKCVFNDENRGFAGGNNDGIAASSGRYVILLNSDCLVTPGWMEGLIRPLAQDKSTGLSGPVSNSVGNEQKIFTSGAAPEEVIAEGAAWVAMSRGSRFDTKMLSFFCVAIRRDVLEKVGPLDEDFGVGFYEDDDYCIRAQKAGYGLVCVEDVFVWHRGSGSFGKMGDKTRGIMKENRRKLEEKHGFSFAPLHPRQRQLNVIEGYLDRAAGGPLGEDLLYRISNRMREIESRMPRGIFKRWAFERRLRVVRKRLSEAENG